MDLTDDDLTPHELAICTREPEPSEYPYHPSSFWFASRRHRGDARGYDRKYDGRSSFEGLTLMVCGALLIRSQATALAMPVRQTWAAHAAATVVFMMGTLSLYKSFEVVAHLKPK
jgi:hypothetical protein